VTPTCSTTPPSQSSTKVTDEFILEFQGGKGQAINKPGHEEVAAAHAEDVNQEQIVKGRRG
jgi:F-type H+-transporting ATPase subunit alpha